MSKNRSVATEKPEGVLRRARVNGNFITQNTKNLLTGSAVLCIIY